MKAQQLYFLIDPITEVVYEIAYTVNQCKQFQHDHDLEAKTVIKTFDEVYPEGI